MSCAELARLVRSVSDLAAAVRQAGREDKAEIYRPLGVTLTDDSRPSATALRALLSD
ncbi:hypothetical protein ACFYYH_01160 [Streptomyces sp. NPDC002018]|uniref:hypothetical protein n=1 Tax=Streptomyces sp. NPDC002018 TaxID=3364629 RepID=UPI0036BDD381